MNSSENESVVYQSFIFTHIPKCGGTSFRNYIYDAGVKNGIDRSTIYIPGKDGLKFDKNIIGLSEEEIKRVQSRPLKLMACHAHYDVHRQYQLKMAHPFYYTIFREPVSRVISHHNHFLFRGEDDRFKNRYLQDLEPDELDEALIKQANLQTRYIANVKNSGGYTLNQDALDQAQENLQKRYACFGLLEYIDTSIRLIQVYAPDWLRFEGLFPHERKNETPSKDPTALREDVLERIQHFNRYDLKLYDFARTLFIQRCEENNISSHGK